MKKLLKFILYFFAFIAMAAVCLIAPIDRTPLEQQPFYQSMMRELDTLELPRYAAIGQLKVGWSKVNITPNYAMPMAGYTPKDRFETVHDSIYCRVLAISNESSQSFIISIDLILFPPVIKQKINEQLKSAGKNYFLYFSATHTHSSLGGWDGSTVGRFTIGKYQEKWVDETTQKILAQLEIAKNLSLPATLSYGQTDASSFVENRLDTESPTDGWLRGIKVVRSDSSKAILTTFSGHPTTIDLLGRTLSGDYCAMLTNKLESHGYQFGMFLAGMVGSHRIIGFEGDQYQKITAIGDSLAAKVLSASFEKPRDSIAVVAKHIPIQFGPSQLHFEKNWKARDWAFRWFVRPLQGELSYLQLGNIILIGTPCDFSGEIYANANFEKWCRDNNRHLIITSFNGDYTGYITADRHYDKNQEEVMALNWVGPHFEKYYVDMLERVLRSSTVNTPK